ncbi:MerR family transcriptional regulator [Streptomyces sp. H27-D2]|uniref:MerR family transcriptional regulator n=1 Tax=Streptomyces sp. H27-D2 TaxID=3046304 RepID=UPI002DBDD719|nr:MerR family transcriptional regulator [Streptomyces sp. H27-D2]MEC4016226.1 MerR family transcriptional regulator [Streptomyces sp. H27-D2]
MKHAQEYRIEELARAAGVKVRNLRYYQERGLLPPPRRAGRIAWYSEDHLARLRLIADLLRRGYAVSGIAELLAAWDQGSGVDELLGLERAMTQQWSQEEPVVIDFGELAALFGHGASEADIARAVELGYISIDGDTVTHVSRRLLDSTLALVNEGVPLATVLEAGQLVQTYATALADHFVAIIRAHVLGELGLKHLPPAEVQRIAEAVATLRPVAGDVVSAEFSRAMERRVGAEFGEILSGAQESGRADGTAGQ